MKKKRHFDFFADLKKAWKGHKFRFETNVSCTNAHVWKCRITVLDASVPGTNSIAQARSSDSGDLQVGQPVCGFDSILENRMGKKRWEQDMRTGYEKKMASIRKVHEIETGWSLTDGAQTNEASHGVTWCHWIVCFSDRGTGASVADVSENWSPDYAGLFGEHKQ